MARLTFPPEPFLYDRLIRQFQSPEERQAAALQNAPSDAIQVRLLRGESGARAHVESGHAPRRLGSPTQEPDPGASTDRNVLLRCGLEQPENKEEGMQIWRREMTERFLRGEDCEFDYAKVDTNDEWDDREEEQRREEERYFNEESPEWLVENCEEGILKDETGVQDF